MLTLPGTVLGVQWLTKVPAIMEHPFYCRTDSKEMSNFVVHSQVRERAVDENKAR